MPDQGAVTATQHAPDAQALAEWLRKRDTMAERNRDAFDNAQKTGTTSWTREEFRFDGGELRIVKIRVPVPVADPDEPAEWKAKFVDDHGNAYYDQAAWRQEAALWAPRLIRPREGHAPREGGNDRRRGSRRGGRATSSSSDDPDPPPSARPCARGCGRPREQRNSYCRECLRAINRSNQRTHRRRDRANPEVARDRKADYAVAHGHPLEPAHCECGGQGAEQRDHQWICVFCGRAIRGAHSAVNGRIVEDLDVLEVFDAESRRGVRLTVIPRPWRTRLNPAGSGALRRRDRERGYNKPRRHREPGEGVVASA